MLNFSIWELRWETQQALARPAAAHLQGQGVTESGVKALPPGSPEATLSSHSH